MTKTSKKTPSLRQPIVTNNRTFILEEILTLSGLVDLEQANQASDADFTDDGLLAAIAGEPVVTESLEAFDSGTFQVTGNGEVTFDFLFDGGGYKGELGIFSLEGMDALDPNSSDFIQEAAQRVSSGTDLGHIVISDPSEGAKFSGNLTHDGNFNSGEYLGPKTVTMKPGDRFGLMLVPNGSFQEVLENPDIGGAKRPLFSMATANPEAHFHVGQLADVTGDGNTFVFEDLRVDTGLDEDYNDLVFQVRGASGEAPLMDEFVDPDLDWRDSELGQEVISYAEESYYDTQLENIETEIDLDIDETINSIDTENDSFLEELETVTYTPEDLLSWETSNLLPNFVESLDTVTELVEQDIESLPDESDTYFEDVVIEDLPADLVEAFSTLENEALQQLSEQNSELQNSKDELRQVSEELEFDFADIDEAVNELEILLAESDSSDEVQADILEFKSLIQEFKDELRATLDTDDFINEESGLLSDLYIALEEDEDTVSSPLYVGDANLFDFEQSEELGNLEFPETSQPLIGIVDTGFAANNPDIDYSRITVGKDYLDGDDNSLLVPGEGDEHGTHILGLIAATQANSLGINGLNDDAPVWVSRAVESGEWARALVDFTDTFIASEQPNAVINLSFDLVQVNEDGIETTRYELTDYERQALEYAQQNGVLVVVAAGNENEIPSALGQASQEFDNVITVGAVGLSDEGIEEFIHHDDELADLNRADYSNYGTSLDILAAGGSEEDPVYSTVEDGLGIMSGTSVAAAKVTGAASLVWAANPDLSYQQVIAALKESAIDLATEGEDLETGAGLLDVAAAVNLALATMAVSDKPQGESIKPISPEADQEPIFYERPAKFGRRFKKFRRRVSRRFKRASRRIRRAATRIGKGLANFGRRIKRFGVRAFRKTINAVKKVGSFIGRATKRTFNFVKKASRFIWNGVKSVARQTWYNLQGIYNRVVFWIRKLPKRVAQVVSGLWEAVKNLKPWSLSWWRSLGDIKTWKGFIYWLGKHLLDIYELLGYREALGILFDFFDFTTRPLSPGEINTARSVYGNTINYALVRVGIDNIIARKIVENSGAAQGNYIFFKDKNDIYDEDRDGKRDEDEDVIRSVLLIHEMGHVWQWQNYSVAEVWENGRGTYQYGGPSSLRKLKNKGFDLQSLVSLEAEQELGFSPTENRFGREVQAELIEDYYAIRMREFDGEFKSSYKRSRGYGSIPEETYKLKPEDLPLYVHFVKGASSLSESQLMGVGEKSRSPQLFREAYENINGFEREIYPVIPVMPPVEVISPKEPPKEPPSQDVYPVGRMEIQEFSEQDGTKRLLILEDGVNSAYWAIPEIEDQSLQASQPLFDTGVDLQQGEKIAVFAEGEWSNVGNNSPNAQKINANGYQGYFRPSSVYPQFPFSSLVGKIGNQVFNIGTDFSGSAPATGRLFLQMNDDPGTFGDNSGELKITVAKVVG